MKNLVFISVLSLLFTACTSLKNDVKKQTNILEKKSVNYVSKSYYNKDKGYDWISVNLQKYDNHTLKVKVRSRADKKRATCTLDTLAYKTNENQYNFYSNNKTLNLILTNNTLQIKGKTKDDENALYYFCSGGASLKGTYYKFDSDLDQKQIDKTSYINTLTYGKYTFFIESINNKLTIRTYDLKYSKKPFIHDIKEEVVFSQIADLNADSYPEIYIYLKDDKNFAKLIAYSVNGGVSMSDIYLPLLKDDKKLSSGYNGNDEFRVVENRLVRRFPLENGKIKQIQYKLFAGEASWQLKANKVIEY